MKKYYLIVFFLIVFSGFSFSQDTLREPYHYYYLSDLSLKEVGTLMLTDSIHPSDNKITFDLMDHISECEIGEFPFYFSVFNQIVKQADGAVAETVGSYIWRLIKKRPKEFVKNLDAVDDELVDRWAGLLVYKMYFSCPSDSLKYYNLKLFDSLIEIKSSKKLLLFKEKTLKSIKLDYSDN